MIVLQHGLIYHILGLKEALLLCVIVVALTLCIDHVLVCRVGSSFKCIEMGALVIVVACGSVDTACIVG